VARAVVAAGARLVILARGVEALRAAATALDALRSPGVAPTLALSADLAQPRDVDQALARLAEALGTRGVDIVVNNAGAFALGAIGAFPPAEVERMFGSNVLGPVRLLQSLVPGLRARGDGHLVTIGSIADRQVFPENAAYAASKHGMRVVHEVLRDELRGTGVRATLVSPGPVDTALWDAIDPDARAGFTPRARMLRPDDVADAVLFALTRPKHVDVDELRLTHA
jgi:NADP-dependent 3-hydroxy acid dehydrogenase YdfG